MIRLLGADSGARQSLLQMMDLSSIARLQCTGRSWCGWIAKASFIGARTIAIQSGQLNPSSSCPWLRRSVQHLQYQGSRDKETAPVVLFHQLLLLQWIRLRSIQAIFFRSVPSAKMLRASFASVAATLQRVDLVLRLLDPSAATVLTVLSSLHQLESLSIDSTCDLPGMDLSALPALPRLQQFTLRFLDGPCSQFCNPAQVADLAQCKSLTDLACGQWLPMQRRRLSVVQLTDGQLQQLDDGLGRLLRLRNENGAAPLRRLHLGEWRMILPPCLRTLSQFTALEELDAQWSCSLTAADWMLLANFPRLHSLSIAALESEHSGEVANSRALLDLGLVLTCLVHCRALRNLDLRDVFDLRTEHVALLAQIPSLESFRAHCIRVESLEPLSHAPALTELRFLWCVGLNGEPVNIRALIPPMPLVNRLIIHDESRSRLSASEADPLNAALLARLPKLSRDRFIRG